ncbi:MAG: hypothetical protein K1X82_01655 [Bacteroidia bacterium]|nr:hypothetical protein [Bacteroidia bacterium]
MYYEQMSNIENVATHIDELHAISTNGPYYDIISILYLNPKELLFSSISFVAGVLIAGLLFFVLNWILQPSLKIQRPCVVLKEGLLDKIIVPIVNKSLYYSLKNIKIEGYILYENQKFDLKLDNNFIKSIKSLSTDEYQYIINVEGIIEYKNRNSDISTSLKDYSYIINSPNSILRIIVYCEHSLSGLKRIIKKNYRRILYNYQEV